MFLIYKEKFIFLMLKKFVEYIKEGHLYMDEEDWEVNEEEEKK